ncbi:unnamed protein product, partial [Ectocarpus sp. 12 AP-2014]
HQGVQGEAGPRHVPRSHVQGVHARYRPEESRDPADREVDQVHFQAVPTLPVEGGEAGGGGHETNGQVSVERPVQAALPGGAGC